MIKNIVLIMSVLAFSLSATASTYDSPEMPLVVETIEVDKLKISINDSKGFILWGKKKLKITAETRAYKDDVSVPLSNALDRKNKYVEVSYDFKTAHVLSIVW